MDGRIRQIKFRDHTHAWGIGGGGAILITSDQGKNWERLQLTKEEEASIETDWFDELLGEIGVPAQPVDEADSTVLSKLDELSLSIVAFAAHGS